MLAQLTSCPELVVSEPEIKSMCVAAEKVASHYDIRTTQKTLDWCALFYALASVYGTRAIAISIRLRNERGQEASGGNGYGGPQIVPSPEGADPSQAGTAYFDPTGNTVRH